MESTGYSCQISMPLEIFQQIFENTQNMKFHEKSVHWEPSWSMRANRRTDMKTLIVAFRNFANTLQKLNMLIFSRAL